MWNKILNLRRRLLTWKSVERAKDVLEILAIVVAGFWAGSLYWNYEAPSNVTRADLQGSLKWYGRSKDVCEAEYEIEFKNIGKTQIDVGRVRLSAFPMSSLDDLSRAGNVKLIVPLNAISGPALIQEETDRLSEIYAPDERDIEDFSFIVKRSPGSLMLFKAEVWKREDSANSSAAPSWQDFRWDWVCGENPATLEEGK
jgi:hypothetical protein